MKVIVGTSALWPTPQLAAKILTIMASTECDFGIRSKDFVSNSTSSTEEMVHRIGQRLGRNVVHFAPMLMSGSSAGFERDVRLVRAADEVFAFFGAEGPVEGGTAHVVECALRQGIPVTAYGLDDDGSIIEIGHDAGNFYRYAPGTVSGQLTEEIGWAK